MISEKVVEFFGFQIAVELLAFLGVLLSSAIAGAVAYSIARLQAASNKKSFERELELQLKKFHRDMGMNITSQKLEVAHKFAELKSTDGKLAEEFLKNIAKETAIAFVYLDDEDLKSKIWIRDNSNLLFGRSPGCDVLFSTDIEVSREHCVISTTNGVSHIIPLVPTNPVFLNKEKVTQKETLRDGDEFSVARHKFRYYSL